MLAPKGVERETAEAPLMHDTLGLWAIHYFP